MNNQIPILKLDLCVAKEELIYLLVHLDRVLQSALQAWLIKQCFTFSAFLQRDRSEMRRRDIYKDLSCLVKTNLGCVRCCREIKGHANCLDSATFGKWRLRQLLVASYFQ